MQRLHLFEVSFRFQREAEEGRNGFQDYVMGLTFFPVLLIGVVFLYGLDTGCVEATTCTSVTDYTCPVTHLSKGACQNGHCACTDGYSPGIYGCQKDLTRPSIRMSDNEALPVGTGILALLSMTCEPDENDVTYTWRRNGTVISESGATVVHSEMRTAPFERFLYSCQYSIDGRDSPESDDFELEIFAKIDDIDQDDHRFKPAVRGIPSTVAEGQELHLSCVNYIYHQVQKVEWKLANQIFNGMELTVNITKGMDDSLVSCTIIYSLDMPFKSPEVRIPKISDDIPNVIIEGGDRFVDSGRAFNLTCNFVEDDFVTRGISITWGWSLNGVPDPSLTTQSITIQIAQTNVHEGQWRCSATDVTNVKKESAPIQVYVDLPINITAVARPARAIQGGIMEIVCEVYSPVMVTFSYGWTLNGVDLMGYIDDVIFINFADDSSSTFIGDYICVVTVGLTTAVSDIVTVKEPIQFSDTPAPTLQVKGNPQEFVYGDMYELECLFSEEFTVPGIQFEYFYEGFPLDNSSVTLEDIGYQELTCRAVFNGLETSESKGLEVSVKGGPDSSSSPTSIINSTDETTGNLSMTEPLVTQATTLNASSSPTSLLRIEVVDNATDDTTFNSTAPSVSQDSNTSPNSTSNPDTESTKFDTVKGTLLGAGRGPGSTSKGRRPTLVVIGQSLKSIFFFNQEYQLKCQLYDEDGHDEVTYEFYQGDAILQTSESDVYTITNDVVNKVYTCKVVSSNMSSPMSNAVVVSFEVFEKVQITWKESDVTTCSAKVTLGCEVDLLPGVPDEVKYTWFDKEMDIIDKSRTLTFGVTEGFLSTFYCQAEVGSHSKMATLTIVVRGTDEHCSACSISVCWTLMLITTILILSLH